MSMISPHLVRSHYQKGGSHIRKGLDDGVASAGLAKPRVLHLLPPGAKPATPLALMIVPNSRVNILHAHQPSDFTIIRGHGGGWKAAKVCGAAVGRRSGSCQAHLNLRLPAHTMGDMTCKDDWQGAVPFGLLNEKEATQRDVGKSTVLRDMDQAAQHAKLCRLSLSDSARVAYWWLSKNLPGLHRS